MIKAHLGERHFVQHCLHKMIPGAKPSPYMLYGVATNSSWPRATIAALTSVSPSSFSLFAPAATLPTAASTETAASSSRCIA
jgi:hypothetical protein